MRTWKFTPEQICGALLILCSVFVVLTSGNRTPLSDFGNYYYGSRILQHNGAVEDVYDVMDFNRSAQALNGSGLFLNHCTVTPQSILLYRPFATFSDPHAEKLFFNCFGVLVFIISLYRFLKRYTPEIEWKQLLLFTAALIPVYYNILFGQTYLLIAGLLMETILNAEKIKWLSGLCLALAITLKISPAIFIVWLLSEKKYQIIAWTAGFWIAIMALTAIAYTGMTDILISFYTESMPRMMNGFVSDPYTSSFQGFVVFLRKLMLPDTILNPHSLINSSERMVQLLNTVFFIGISVLLVGAWKKTLSRNKKILLLLLVMNITSGYTSTYSLLLMVPFIEFGNTTRDWIKVMLYGVVLMFPPRIFDGYSAFAEEYKLWIFIALLVMECNPTFGFKRIEKPQLIVGSVFLAMIILKFAHRPEEMRLNYYRPDIVNQDYVLYAFAHDSSLTYVSYADGSFRSYRVPLKENWTYSETVYPSVHGVAFRAVGENEENMLVLSDYHRGPGLFHLYIISKSEFKSITGQ